MDSASLSGPGEKSQSSDSNDNELPDTRLESTVHDRIWMEKYRMLVDFKESKGNCNVPKEYKDNKILGSWVSNQRSSQRAGSLRKDREQLLNDIGFVWSKPRDYYDTERVDEQWIEKYRRLVGFKEKNGHFCFTKSDDDEDLATWVANQRTYHRAGRLRNDREQLLNDIGFVWSKPEHSKTKPSDEVRWMDKYKRLTAFKDKTGHFQVPAAEDKELSNWIYEQRKQFRLGKLHKDRRELLNKMDFVWITGKSPTKENAVAPVQNYLLNSALNTDEPWNRMIVRLNCFFHKHGHINIQADAEYQDLLEWVSLQRRLRKDGLLGATHEKALEEIGLSWEIPAANVSIHRDAPISNKNDELWMSQFQSLCDYKKTNGHTDVPRTGETSQLGHWLDFQQRFLGRGKLSEDKKMMLLGVLTTEAPASKSDVPKISAAGSGSSQISVAEETKDLVGSPAKQLETVDQKLVIADIGDAPSKPLLSQANNGEPSRENQKFGIGTRVKKLFEVAKGKMKSFGGKVVSFEVFEEDDGARKWGYMIHYDDGDKEHMLEAEVAKHVVVSRDKERKNSEEKPKSTRPKKAAVSVKDTTSIASNKEKDDTLEVEMGTDVAENASLNLNGVNRTKKSQEKLKPSQRPEEAVASVQDTPSIDLNKEMDDTVEDKTVTDVSDKGRVNQKGKKRTKTGEAKLKPSKRQKKAVASEKATTSIGLNKEKDDTDEVKKGTDVSEKARVKIIKRKKPKTSYKSGKGHEKPKSLSETIDTAPVEACSSPRLNEKPPNERTISTTHSSQASNLPAIQSQTKSIHARDKEAQGHQSLQRKELDPASVADEPREFSVRTSNHTRATEDELIGVGDSAGADSSPAFNDPLSNAEGRRRFPNGTRISRIFFDMGDNEQTKACVGKTVDYIYLDDERDWFYFVQYDDGDTEFMDDWEVAKFSAMA